MRLWIVLLVNCYHFTVKPACASVKQRALLEKQLRQQLFSNYHPETVPASLTDPVKVEFGLNIYKIHNLDLKTSTLSLRVWLRMQWVDPRLAFNATEYAELDPFLTDPYLVIDPDQIWTPDIELFNHEHSVYHSEFGVTPHKAKLSPSGAIFWSRPGILQVLCKFRGLEAFPYDDLSCVLVFGSWLNDGSLLDIIPRGVDCGFTWYGGTGCEGVEGTGGAEAGMSFQDYNITGISVVLEKRVYDCCPNKPWPSMLFTLSLSRATGYYMWKMFVPLVLLVISSFIQFFMSPATGERLGFSITVILAVTAADIVAAGLMPICAEQLWMQTVSQLCLVFCIVGLVETSVVLYLHHCKAEDWNELLPKFAKMSCLRRWSWGKQIPHRPDVHPPTPPSPSQDSNKRSPKRQLSRKLSQVRQGSSDSLVSSSSDALSEAAKVKQMRRLSKEFNSFTFESESSTTALQEGAARASLEPSRSVGELLGQAPDVNTAAAMAKVLPKKADGNATASTDLKGGGSPKKEPSFGKGRERTELEQNIRRQRTGSEDRMIVVDSFSNVRNASKLTTGSVKREKSMKSVAVTQEELRAFRMRSQLYRQAFYILDVDFSGDLSAREINKFGEFMLGNDWSEDLFYSFMRMADADESGTVSEEEFLDFAESVIVNRSVGLTSVHDEATMQYLVAMIKGFLEMVDRRVQQNVAMWQFRAKQVDNTAIATFPMIFCALMAEAWINRERPRERPRGIMSVLVALSASFSIVLYKMLGRYRCWKCDAEWREPRNGLHENTISEPSDGNEYFIPKPPADVPPHSGGEEASYSSVLPQPPADLHADSGAEEAPCTPEGTCPKMGAPEEEQENVVPRRDVSRKNVTQDELVVPIGRSPGQHSQGQLSCRSLSSN